MNTAFREAFDADLSAIRNAGLLLRIKKVIEQVEAARTFQQIPNLKRLEASGRYAVQRVCARKDRARLEGGLVGVGCQTKRRGIRR